MIVHTVSVIPDYLVPGTTFVSNEYAKSADCDCRILIGVKVTNGKTSRHDAATVARPCKPEHGWRVDMATENLRLTIGDPTLRDKPLIEVVDAMLSAVPSSR